MYRCMSVGRIDVETNDRLREMVLDVRLNLRDRFYDKLLLIIDSSGGNLTEALQMVHLIRNVRIKVPMLAVGECKSAAVPLMAAGLPGQRVSLMGTRFMVHASGVHYRGEMDLDAFAEDVSECIAERRRERDLQLAILAEMTGMTSAFWAEKMKLEKFFFSAEQAKEWGVIDHIVGSFEEAAAYIERDT